MRLFVIIALAIFWIVMASIEFKRGDPMLGGVFILVGIALTSYRLMRWRGVEEESLLVLSKR